MPTRSMARKRRRPPTPAVLRRAYGGRVKKLESSILSLLPSPPPDSPLDCSCNGRLCLGCMRESHLISEADPPEYLRFLTQSFCFLSPLAPPPPINFCAAGLGPSHVNGVGFLAARATYTHVWNLLLERIGEKFMAFLLHYSSIFVPLANDNYLQVTGESLEGRKFQISVRPPRRQLKCVDKESKVANVLRVLPKMRRPCVPIILRQIFGSRVSTFKSIILSLLPKTLQSSSLDCCCKGRICLGCLGVSYLIQPGDPKDYLRLLLCSYCFLPFDAPAPPCNFLASGLTLSSIVRNVIEFLLGHPKFHKNVLCTGKPSVFFSAVTVAGTNSWDLLLMRIGDELMAFLLKYSAIFICLTDKYLQQIAGNPLKTGLSKDVIFSSLKVGKVGDFHPSKFLEVPADNALRSSRKDVTESSSSSRKRRREFSWQRRRKHKKLEEAAKTIPGSERHAYHVEDQTSVKMSKSGFVKDNFLAGDDILQEQSMKKNVPCFNCVLLHSPSKVEIRTQIKRKLMFYTRQSSHSLFPRQHILNRLKPNNPGAISLLKHIFGVCANDTESQMLCSYMNSTSSEVLHSCLNSSESKCLFHLLVSLLKSLIRNSQRCQYKKLLCRHCMNPALKKNSTIGDGSVREYGLIDSYSTHQQVVSFVWAVTRSLVPKDLLGDYFSWRALRKNISIFVKLRRSENFSVTQCLHGLKASHYPILSRLTFSHQSCCEIWRNVQNPVTAKKYSRFSFDGKLSLQRKILWSWIYWYFSYIVVPLLGNHFYVTERESGRQDVFYYSKPIWKKLFDGTVTLLQDKNYSILDHTLLGRILKERKNSLGHKAFGFSRVRFLPKEKNLRTLANLKAPSKFLFTGKKNARGRVRAVQEQSKSIWFKSANSALRELHVVLRRIKAEDPNKLGASVFDYNDMYQRFYQFICEVRKGSAVFPKLYIVVADISNAYDSIDQDMLISIMNDVIQQDSFCLRNISKIVRTKKLIKAIPDQLCCDQVNVYHDAVKIEGSLHLNSSHCILVDMGTGVEVNKQMLHRLLTEHVKHNIMQIGHNYYLQEVGIPQGSILSALLCSFYYAHLERNVLLPFLAKTYEISAKDGKTEQSTGANEDFGNKLAQKEKHWNMNNYVAGASAGRIKIDSSFKQQNLLLRFIDDFLFISTSKQQAASFFTRLQRGFRSYNCYMNYEKFGLNFDVEAPLPSKWFYSGADGIQFIPWSGLLINCENLEIQADYTRYWSIHMSSTITVQAYAKPGITLGKKLCDYMRPKCHPLFYDSNIDSLPTVALNAYQAFLLCAMKFHCCVRSMPSISKLYPSYILGKILLSFRYMYRLIKKRMRSMEIRFNMKPILKLKKVEMLWLGLSAYIRVLKKKQSRYRELIYLLRRKIAEHGVDHTLPHLRYAVDDSHSSLFWKIRY